MNDACYWNTPYRRHEIPMAIIGLAIQAERKATGRWMWCAAMPQATFPHEQETVWFKVIAEWGAWREEQDRIEHERRAA